MMEKRSQSYKDLEVYSLGKELAVKVHKLTLEKLPKFKNANANEAMTAKIDGLKSQGVEFNVCDNTVRGRKVNIESDLYNVDKKDIVPSGVAEVARLQGMGYSYIKP